VSVPDVPEPDDAIEEVREGRGSLRPPGFPALRVLGTEVLFDVAERVFDGPAVGKLRDDGRRSGGEVGGDEEVLFLLVPRHG